MSTLDVCQNPDCDHLRGDHEDGGDTCNHPMCACKAFVWEQSAPSRFDALFEAASTLSGVYLSDAAHDEDPENYWHEVKQPAIRRALKAFRAAAEPHLLLSLRAHLEERTREVERLKAEAVTEGLKVTRTLERLERAKADTERLDWMEYRIENEQAFTFDRNSGKLNLRKEIDAARLSASRPAVPEGQ